MSPSSSRAVVETDGFLIRRAPPASMEETEQTERHAAPRALSCSLSPPSAFPALPTLPPGWIENLTRSPLRSGLAHSSLRLHGYQEPAAAALPVSSASFWPGRRSLLLSNNITPAANSTACSFTLPLCPLHAAGSADVCTDNQPRS